MKELLKSCISKLKEMLHSSEMTLADKSQLRSVIARLETLDRDLADEQDQAKRRTLIFQTVEHVARIAVSIFLD